MKLKVNLYFIVAFFLILSSCSFSYKAGFNKSNHHNQIDSIFDAVVLKLKYDSISFETCKFLYVNYLIKVNSNDTLIDNYLNIYIYLYNKGNAFIRLIKKNKLDVFYRDRCTKYKNSPVTSEEYFNLINKYVNFNSDKEIGGENSQVYYFKEYLNKGLVLPESH